MILYFNGDSFTAGDELIDDQFPGFPGVGPRKENKSWRQARHEILSRLDFGSYITDCKKETWAQLLSNLAGAECINGAKGGSSMMGIMFRTSKDLLRLSQENKIPDKVFIQLTGRFRTGIYNSALSDHLFSTDDLIINNIYHLPAGDPKIDYLNAWVSVEDDNAMIIRWLHHAHLIKHLVISLTGKAPIFVDSIFMEYDLEDFIGKKTNNRTIEMLKSDLGFEETFNPDLRLKTFHNPLEDGFLPQGHYPKIVHERFSKALYERFFKCGGLG